MNPLERNVTVVVVPSVTETAWVSRPGYACSTLDLPTPVNGVSVPVDVYVRVGFSDDLGRPCPPLAHETRGSVSRTVVRVCVLACGRLSLVSLCRRLMYSRLRRLSCAGRMAGLSKSVATKVLLECFSVSMRVLYGGPPLPRSWDDPVVLGAFADEGGVSSRMEDHPSVRMTDEFPLERSFVSLATVDDGSFGLVVFRRFTSEDGSGVYLSCT